MTERLRPVEVVWLDAALEDEYGVVDAWAMGPIELRTVGYLSAENDEAIVVAMTICTTDNKVVTEQMVIPWDMVVEWGDLD